MKTSLYAIASFFSLQSKKLVIPAFLILSSLPSLAQPTVTDVTEPINWPYTYNATLTFKVTFSETVTVSGFPYLAITLNSSGTPVQAGYRAGSGTNTLTFQYIIRNGDFDDDGITMDAASALNLNGGSIKNGSGANALLPLSGLDPLTGIRVDAVPPVVTGVTGISGAYGYGQEVLITVHFSEPVDVSGTPELGLNVFGRASYVSGTGTTALVFKYIVAEGDAVADLDYYSFGSLTGGSLVDAGSNAAIRALPVPGTAGSLGANANIVIEALTPVTQATGIQVSALTGTSATLSWTNGSGNRRAVFMKAASSGSAVPQNTKYYAPYPTFGLGVEIGTTAWYCVYNGTGTTINVDGLVAGTSYRVMVTEYNNGSDGAHYNTTAAADNPISFTTSSPPAVISITEPVDWMYLHTSLMTFTVTFNEDVTVSGLPYLAFTMNSSGTPKHAVYKEGSGTNTLTFEYSVEDGDSDDDGITMNGATALNLDGGSIKNNSNMDARLPLSGLDPMTGVRVDGIVPVVTGVTGTSGLYRTGGEVLITVHFSEPVNVGGTPMLGLADALAAYVSGSGTTALVFKYTVATGDAEADLDYYSSNSIAAGTLEDVNGNPANRFLPAPGAAGSLGANADIVIDAITPVTQASDIQVASVTGTTALLSWTNGSGSRHAVFMKAASSGTVAPENSESYFPHSTFGMGTLIVSTGWFCVYNDIGTTVSVNGLTTGTTYQVMVVDYNSGNGSASYGTYYNTSTAAGNPASFTTLYAPAGISLSATAINENVAAGSAVGTFTATDAEGGAMVYTLVGGTGSSNNSSFTIDGDVLKINASPDYETKASYSIRVRVTDNSLLTFEKQFTITINDLPEANVTVSETSLPGFTACAGSVSSEQSFSVSGTGLTAGLVVTAPDGFEVSATSGSGYSASVSLTPASGAVSSTAIYIRTGTLATGTPSGNVTVTSTGAADHNIAVSATVNVSTTADGSITNTSTGRTYCSIQAAIDDPLTLDGHTISLGAGNYIEDVLLNKSITLQGAGSGTTTIYGAIGGQASTILIQANNIIIEKLGIARQGNTVADWNNPGLNTAGIQITGQSYTNTEIRNCRIAVNRTGIDINNSSGHSIHNNIIGVNRIGIVFRNQTENISVVSNSIVDNWAVGILFLDGSGGTNSPVQSAAGSTFSNNTISGNWYGQVIDRQAGGNLPDPGTTNGKDFRCNDFGTPDPIVTTANSAEPGYASQIPFVFGGPATAPGGQPDIAGPASANILYTAKPVISTGVLTLCAGGSVTLTSSSATGNQWYLDGSPVAGATDQTYGATIAGNYTVIVTDGCTWPASDAVTVTASPEPEITLGAITPVSGTTTSFTIPFTGNTAVSYALNASSSGNAMTGFVPATGNLAGSSIDVTIPASASGTYDFVLTIHTADNCSRDYPLSLVVASPSISAGTIATPLSATYGAPSVSQSFAVSGTDMNEAILVTAPAGFEVSLDDNNYSNTVTVGSAGVISSTTVYTRIKEAINAGPLSGDVVLSAAGAGDVNVGVSGVVHPAPLTITANDAGKIYGEELTGASGSAAFAATGLQYGETVGDVTITYGNGGAASDAAGTYSGSVVASDITGGTFNSANYTITYTAGQITVDPKAIIITAEAKNKAYGDNDPALTYTHSPELVTGDVFSGSLSRDPGEDVGTYTINQNTLALSSNYTITYNNAQLTIGARAVTVTAEAKSKAYGDSDPALTYTYSPELATGDAFTGSLSRDPGENGGNYAINQNDLALSSNYTITYNSANLAIGAKTITVTAEAKSKTYGASDPSLTYTYSPELATGDA
ncbi:MAG: MBG domain-containing protein, partial [Chitinophagaceae bacterium]